MSTNGQLKAYIERLQNKEAEIKELNDEKSEIFQEIKKEGFDIQVVRQVLAILRKGEDKYRERETLVDTYLSQIR
ncbi:hypothetical protein BA190_07875 [Labrys sp. WJW]|uniref:GapR family DNA-binding domain-containing protein n=1 Tax=Labrys sp. WJW TaxID=1737983 RepID=UPI0008378CBE|nr:GapR family DNA-binding domain-containing protein [Labrys sp. WJW]OCC05348.1 hypothetical protein BA190_07875 [Labrys sp. WJW]